MTLGFISEFFNRVLAAINQSSDIENLIWSKSEEK